MAKTKYIMHDCAYCHKATKMERIGGLALDGAESDPSKVWFRCTRCKHSALLTIDPQAKDRKSGTLSIERSGCTEYSAEKVFSVGQDIYHKGLDDMGRVVRKDKTSGGIQSIVVTFVNSGERKLLENSEAYVDEPESSPQEA